MGQINIIGHIKHKAYRNEYVIYGEFEHGDADLTTFNMLARFNADSTGSYKGFIMNILNY
jgi:hypothetical protein